MEQRFYRIPETAKIFDVSPKTITNNWIPSGYLRVTRFGRNVRISREEIERLISEGTAPVRAESCRGRLRSKCKEA